MMVSEDRRIGGLRQRTGAVALGLALAAGAASATLAAAPKEVSSDGFTAMEAVTVDPARFVAAWGEPGDHADLPVDARAKAGQSVTPFILFKGCKAGENGACKVTAEIRIVDPSGKASDPAAFDAWIDPPLPNDALMRANTAPNFGFDKGDPAGRYVLRAVVKDAVSGAEVTLEEPIEYTR